MKTAQSIINDARFELTKLIISLMRKLDAYFKTGKKNLMTSPENEEGVIIDFADCVYAPTIRVEVDNSYLDVEDTCYEERVAEYIAVGDDYNFYVNVVGCDIEAVFLSTDELYNIAKALEDTYNKAE